MKKNKFRIIYEIIVFTMLLFSSIVYSQENGILLKNQKTNEVEFIKENKRVKIETIYGESYTGRIKIINSDTISIHNKKIALLSIMKIKRKSITSSIIETVLYTYGGVIFVSCIVVAVTSTPFYLIVMPLSFPFIGGAILIPTLENNHKIKKWTYEIGNNPNTEKL